LALQGFGGVLPVAQRILVEHRRWMTREEFLSLLSMAQVLPGPNIVNMALIFGDRHFGWRGAAAALGGLMLAPLAIVLALAALVQQVGSLPLVVDALRGMGVVAAGLVLSTAVRLVTALRGNCMGLAVCAGLMLTTVAAVAGLRLPLVVVLAAIAPVACLIAWARLKP
jgi:chromate transporter